MGKTRDFRGPRRRGFDDDTFFQNDSYGQGQQSPPRQFGGGFSRAPAAAEGPVTTATVKWFNGEKGFGFVALSDGSGDAFLHIGVLQAAGHEAVAPGATLQVQVGQGPKGPQITRVAEVDETTATAPARSAPKGPRSAPDPASATDLTGTVKWFNGEKGFGFVAGEDGGRDVFIHISVLMRANLATLAEGQRVSMRVVETAKGREAISLNLAD
jgi:CspA family cold shock protein